MKNYDIFYYLCGLSPERVGCVIVSSNTVDILDGHASIVASKYRASTDEFRNTFALFNRELAIPSF